MRPTTLAPTALTAPPAAPVTARPVGGAIARRAPEALFYAYLIVILVEYSGLGVTFPIVNVTRIPTLLAYAVAIGAMSREGVGPLFTYPQPKMFALIVVWSFVSVVWAVVSSMAPSAARFHLDYLLLLSMTFFLVDSEDRLKRLALAVAGVTSLLVVLNLNKLNAERTGEFMAPYFMADGNDFAWGLVSLLPLPLYLLYTRKLWRVIGVGACLVNVVGILGTQSRGATLAIIAGLFVFWLGSKRKALGIAVAAVGITVALAMLPDSYMRRMQTIEHYEEDDSAQQRIRAWRSAVKMAMDYPVGVGANNFSAAYGRFYIPADTSGYMAYRWMSPHSVYFRVLAEYGFPGLLVLLSVIGLTARDNYRSWRKLQRMAAAGRVLPVSEHWPRLLNTGLIMFCVGAVFLGGFTYPHLYLLTGLTLTTRRLVDNASSTAVGEGTAAATAPPPRPVVNGRAQLVTPARRA